MQLDVVGEEKATKNREDYMEDLEQNGFRFCLLATFQDWVQYVVLWEKI